jgi:outer membrane lipoprotein-sorting protein
MRAQIAGVILLGAVLGSPVSRADPAGTTVWSLESMMAGLHQVKSASARFVERKQMALLTQPLESAGTLRYIAPNRLEKTTLTPTAETIVLDGETLTGTQVNGDHYTFALSDQPEVATLVEGIRSTLAGDLATLRRYYTVDLKGNHDDWELDLTPKNQRVRDKVDSIRIKGAELVLKTIDVAERDGDHSQMVITPDGS